MLNLALPLVAGDMLQLLVSRCLRFFILELDPLLACAVGCTFGKLSQSCGGCS